MYYYIYVDMYIYIGYIGSSSSSDAQTQAFIFVRAFAFFLPKFGYLAEVRTWVRVAHIFAQAQLPNMLFQARTVDRLLDECARTGSAISDLAPINNFDF